MTGWRTELSHLDSKFALTFRNLPSLQKAHLRFPSQASNSSFTALPWTEYTIWGFVSTNIASFVHLALMFIQPLWSLSPRIWNTWPLIFTRSTRTLCADLNNHSLPSCICVTDCIFRFKSLHLFLVKWKTFISEDFHFIHLVNLILSYLLSRFSTVSKINEHILSHWFSHH